MLPPFYQANSAYIYPSGQMILPLWDRQAPRHAALSRIGLAGISKTGRSRHLGRRRPDESIGWKSRRDLFTLMSISHSYRLLIQDKHIPKAFEKRSCQARAIAAPATLHTKDISASCTPAVQVLALRESRETTSPFISRIFGSWLGHIGRILARYGDSGYAFMGRLVQLISWSH